MAGDTDEDKIADRGREQLVDENENERETDGRELCLYSPRTVCVYMYICVFAPPKRTNSFLPRTETRAPSRNERLLAEKCCSRVFRAFNGTVRARGV